MSRDGGWRPPDLQSLEAAGDVTDATLSEILKNMFQCQKNNTKAIVSSGDGLERDSFKTITWQREEWLASSFGVIG